MSFQTKEWKQNSEITDHLANKGDCLQAKGSWSSKKWWFCELWVLLLAKKWRFWDLQTKEAGACWSIFEQHKQKHLQKHPWGWVFLLTQKNINTSHAFKVHGKSHKIRGPKKSERALLPWRMRVVMSINLPKKVEFKNSRKKTEFSWTNIPKLQWSTWIPLMNGRFLFSVLCSFDSCHWSQVLAQWGWHWRW